MQSGDVATLPRRSSRVPTSVQILVTSLDGTHFSDVCETLVVNAHGCAILTRVKLDTGVPLHFHGKDGRETTARVVSCQPIGTDHRRWRLGAKLDRPENFWGLKDCPKDWAFSTPVAQPAAVQILRPTNTPSYRELPEPAQQRPDAALDRLARQLEVHVKRMVAESVRPLQAEIVALKERLAQREANPSRFEISLSSIPPELEQQIESRLKRDLGPKVVDEAREQSALLLASAKEMIDQRTSEAHEKVLGAVAEELRLVEKRAQEVFTYISENTQEYLRCGLEDFHRKLLEGGNSLKRLSQELLEFLQQSLIAEHDGRRGDLEQLRTAVESESVRLQEQVAYLDTRIASLDQAARCLESGLDQRLSRISSDTVKESRSQFESAANETLEELKARGVHLLREQLEETRGHMKKAEEGIFASVSESLKGQAAGALQAFEQSTEDLARLAVERWRLRLEGGLIALAKNLNEQFRMEDGSHGSQIP